MKSFFNGPVFAALLILLAIILVVIIYNNISKKYRGFCPKCGKEFKASPLQLIFTIHVFYSFYVKCPHCGHRGMKNFSKDKRSYL